MPPRKKPLKVTTSATKAKLPLPKGHPQVKTGRPRKRREMQKVAKRDTPVINTGLAHPALNDRSPRAIPCGEDTQTTTGTGSVAHTSAIVDLTPKWWEAGLREKPDARIIAQFVTRSRGDLPDDFKAALMARFKTFLEAERAKIEAWEAAQVPPPDTSAYPWPLKFAWRVDGWIVTARRRLAAWLTALAGKVKP